MIKKADAVRNFKGANPFRDHQSRTFSQSRMINEFYPTSIYWSLFNDQHEVLIGRRGSGKTILLRMMRYSALKKINHPNAKALRDSQRYFGLTVSTHIELIGNLLHQEIPEKHRMIYFQFWFNCMLSLEFLSELNSFVNEEQSFIERGRLSGNIAREIAQVWFPEDDPNKYHTLAVLERAITVIYDSSNPLNGDINAPEVFKKTICRPIQAVSSIVTRFLGYKEEPTWLICIDEAEFLPEPFQRCINTLFRADSRKIVIKMATLPYSHLTKETLSPSVFAESNGNDFSYTTIDMKDGEEDFKNVTNNLCRTRLRIALGDKVAEDLTLENFVGGVGHDDWVDYYKFELADKTCNYSKILAGITSQLSESKKASIPSQTNKRKETYDKYAPIYFFREIYKKSKKPGNYTPGWFAGSLSIRKVSEGNPRRFIRLMNEMFEGAKKTHLSLKAQHKIIYKFTENEFNYINSMPSCGPKLHEVLSEIAESLKEQVHGDTLLFKGNSFKINATQLRTNRKLIEALQLGVQYLHIDVDAESFSTKISSETKFTLANYISAFYWIPMRKGDTPIIKLVPRQNNLPDMSGLC